MQQKLRLSIETGEAQLFCMKSKVTLLKSVSLPGLELSEIECTLITQLMLKIKATITLDIVSVTS